MGKSSINGRGFNILGVLKPFQHDVSKCCGVSFEPRFNGFTGCPERQRSFSMTPP